MGYASCTNDEETRVGYVSRTNNGSGRVGYASRPGPMCIDCPMSGSSRSSDTNDGASVNDTNDGASVNIKNLRGNFCSRSGRDARHRRSTRASNAKRRKAFIFAIRSVERRGRDDWKRRRAWACDRFDSFGFGRSSDPTREARWEAIRSMMRTKSSRRSVKGRMGRCTRREIEPPVDWWR